ncbi:AB-hydrolase YheT [Hysterangium stoloniferum]|nr:AB-hydrolase YheT [Hysterangium stoloniferum]
MSASSIKRILMDLLSPRPAAKAQPVLHASRSVASVAVKDTSSKMTLRDFIVSKCPGILKTFKPPWWLFNGHLQTIYVAFGDFSKIDNVTYKRELLAVPDGGTLGLDFTGPTDQEELDPETPILVVLHGLSGGSYEAYVRSIVATACAPKDKGGLGFRGVVVNFRGCAGVELTSAQLYSAGYTDDLRRALFYLSLKFPQAKMVGLGFSLGANVLTRYLGEEGENSKLISGCALACPWDLQKNSYNLENRWLHRNLYSKTMGENLRRLALSHIDPLLRNAPAEFLSNIEAMKRQKSPCLIEVDETLTRFVGGSSPPFPLPSASAYYDWASSHKHIASIRVPFLAISSLDDPIVKDVPLPVPDEANYTVIVTTQGGGHLGWFQEQKKSGFLGVERWVKEPVCEWLRATGEDLIVEPREKEEVETADGFTRMVGKPHIGYKELGSTKVVAQKGANGVLAGL